MATQTLPIETDTPNRENMVHLAFDDSNIALCGARLKGRDVGRLWENSGPPTDCVVCAGIVRSWGWEGSL
jgi:hypothetical protein